MASMHSGLFQHLPPIPRGDEHLALPDDDLVLPRMLMEEDIHHDSFFFQYPDHPAVLHAQQPFADILSDSGSNSAATADANGSGCTACPLSPSSSDVPAFANAIWPYDPLEVTQRLMAGSATSAASSLPGQQDGAQQAGSQSHQSGQNRVSMDMINQAFLKGMEEAKKFLPATNNTLLMDASMEHLSRDSEQPHFFVQTKEEEEAEDRMLQFQRSSGNSRVRKNRHDDLESETGRKSKLMVPEPEESGEMVDKMVIDGYVLCVNKMKSLSITVSTESAKNSSNTSKGATNESADLRTLLIQCAEAVSMADHPTAAQLLRQIKKHSSPTGDATQRLAFCFAEGLEAWLAGTGSLLYRSLVAKRTSVMELLRAYQLYLAVSCFKMTAYRFSNMTISKAIAGKKKLHIVDYGVRYGCQWPNLLDYLAKRKAGPPEVRMTCIEETGRRLSSFASQCGLPFKFHGIAVRWETVRADDLNIDADEVLIVNSITNFENSMDEGVHVYSPSPRDVDVVLSNIRKMRLDVFIHSVVNGSYATPFFVARSREALFYYSAIFDMLDATVSWDNDLRLAVERDLIGRCALNVVACEGLERVERPETYRQWQVRNRKAGLRQLPLFPNAAKILSEKIRNEYHKDFVLDVENHWLLQGWKGRILYAMSTWAADDTISEL